jgi:carbamoyl-phosphate synthase small subunit
VEITSQNHGFAVDEHSLRSAGLEPTHSNLYDGTNEGFRHPKQPLLGVQYHPEAAPGPHDSVYLFDVFREMMDRGVSPDADMMERHQAALSDRLVRASRV